MLDTGRRAKPEALRWKGIAQPKTTIRLRPIPNPAIRFIESSYAPNRFGAEGHVARFEKLDGACILPVGVRDKGACWREVSGS